MLSLGEYNLDDKLDKITFGEALLFCFSSGILALILTNLVIALMSDTYEKVMTSIKESDCRQLNTMVMQYENMLCFKRDGGEVKHLFWVTYSEADGENWVS